MQSIPSPTLLIHHLSDLHIGPFHYAASNKQAFVKDGPTPRNLKLYIEYLRDCPERQLPDFVICSGDFTSYATEAEINEAKDRIVDIVNALQRKQPSWRMTKKAPCFLMVPGNHDLDWSKEKYEQKVDRYARMADALAAGGDVLSPRFHARNQPACWDFGDEVNAFVCLFDTTSLGGVNDPILESIHDKLKLANRHLLESPTNTDVFAEALAELRKQFRKDPGYVRPEDLDEMRKTLKKIPKDRLKIAVMHHNPTSVPSDDIEAFDAIINAGVVKHALIDVGFDLIFHGHRHVFSCTHERSLQPREEWQQGIFIVGADSLGCKERAPFFEVRVWDSDKAHSVFPPASLFQLRLAEHNGLKYHIQDAPFVEEAVHRPMYAAVGEILRRLGRQVDQPKRRIVLDHVRSLLPHLQLLQMSLVDWGEASSEWISKFHYQLGKYSKIYATDMHMRDSYITPRFDNYLREQYTARMARLKTIKDGRLSYSGIVCLAIKRTGWRPSPLLWRDYKIEHAKAEHDTELEIVRVVVRQKDIPEVRDELEKLDFDHKFFAIPLFVLEPKDIQFGQSIDFALGFDRTGGLLKCYEFVDVPGRVEEVTLERGKQLESFFREMLENKALKTVDEFLDYRLMVRDAAKLGVFAESYDETRKASLTLLQVLREDLQPGENKRGLEIGCGTGNYTTSFQDEFKEITGLDANNEMLNVARTKSAKVKWLHANALNSGLPDKAFDAIWLISTLHYFTDIHLEFLFEEIYRMLAPGGVVVADTEFAEQHSSLWVVEFFPSLRERYKNTCLPVAEFKHLLERAGFSEVKFRHFKYGPEERDAGLRIGQHKPNLYLDSRIQGGIPAFKEMPIAELESGVNRLRLAIRDGSITNIIKEYRDRAMMDGDVGVIIAKR